MRINDTQVALYKAVIDAKPEALSKLNQQERKTVLAGLQALAKNQGEIREGLTSQIVNITQKINDHAGAVPSKPSNFITRCIKGVMHALHLRVSQGDIRNVITIIQSQVNEPERISSQIARKAEQLQEWQDLLEFNPKAAAHYENAVRFFQQESIFWSSDPNTEIALADLRKEIREIENGVLPRVEAEAREEFHLKNGREPAPDEVKGGLVKVVRDEVLASLKNLEKYLVRRGPEGYDKELAMQAQVYEKSAAMARDPGITQLAEKEMKKLGAELEELRTLEEKARLLS